MRLSFIFELLLIILIIAFSAYARVLDRNGAHQKGIKNTSKQVYAPIELPSLKQAEETMNKHCYCNENICNCCRDFHIPLVRLTGPGCASLQYLQGDNLQVQLSFGNNVLTTQTISGRNPKPICVALPGGYSKFCGKIYSIKKEADRHFKACLGLELQSSNELEASLRVSCFRFGPEGLKLRPAEEIPVEVTSAAPEEDDDDDLFGLDDDDEEEEDDEEDDGILPGGNQASAGAEDDDEEEEEEDDDDDVLGFGALLDIFTGDDDTTKKPKVTTPSPILQPITIIPFLTTPASLLQSMNQQILDAESISETVAHSVAPSAQPEQSVTEKAAAAETVTEIVTEETATETVEAVTTTDSILVVENENKNPESAEQVELDSTQKPEKTTTAKPKKVAKPSHSSTTHNHIKTGLKKPVKPIQTPDPAINDVVPQEEQEEEDDEDDILDTEDLDEEDDDDDDEKDESENEEEDEEDEEEQDSSEAEESEEVKDEDLEEELVGDDDEEEVEETEALGALIDDEEPKEKKKTKKTKLSVPNKANEAENQEEDDADYGYSLSELLARKTPKVYRGRESKVMRL